MKCKPHGLDAELNFLFSVLVDLNMSSVLYSSYKAIIKIYCHDDRGTCQ